ncbi:GNAT family N-acetyltransferase [Pedobacter jamesrossensis]|uniref:GNAT family N-acetyltransferase n=1 Tax=Pedobacter jamesrossensis TaxID=1908238 RepID=A0ABV8NJ84_9SPHI
MNEIKYEPGTGEPDAFNFYEDGRKIGVMNVETDGRDLTVLHTEVEKESNGKGYAGQLIQAMVDYARKKELKVIPLCPFVRAKFRKEPELYVDIWK